MFAGWQYPEKKMGRLLSWDEANMLLRNLQLKIGGRNDFDAPDVNLVYVTEIIDGTIDLSFWRTSPGRHNLKLNVSRSDAETLMAELSEAIDGV
jgi:hypothetical protein